MRACRLTTTKTRCFLGPVSLACAPSTTRHASRHSLILQRVHDLSIQTLGIAIDSLDVILVGWHSFQARQISHGRSLQDGGPILVYTIKTAQHTAMAQMLTETSSIVQRIGGYLTSALELFAKFSSSDGKIPRISVPNAAAHSVVRMPGLSGSSVTVDSPGSCMYITTKMRR
jgi:hypothetical protein